jgi:hypothetical protein
MPTSYRKRIYLRARGILWGPFEVIAAAIGVFLFLYRPLMSACNGFGKACRGGWGCSFFALYAVRIR